MPNRLAQESSPYLRQHAENPVDWYPWGPEALGRAMAEDKPLLLSIGYSACHWCHVMAHESFENPETAVLMNSLFVNIKVDREERPDLDDVYQHAIQLLGRQGGWPLTVFLTPAGVPFFGGTYFPDLDRHGLPAFAKILRGIAEAYKDRRAEVESSGRQLIAALDGLQAQAAPGTATPTDVAQVQERLLGRVDEEHGGFGGAPKFPNTMALEVLLRGAALDSNARAGTAVHRALVAMADGGIHDQLGGGFHRYSVDEAWAVPHFEKMLYDNALIANLYLAAYQWSDAARYREVAEGIFGYLGRELTDAQGGLYSSQDADSLEPSDADSLEPGDADSLEPGAANSLEPGGANSLGSSSANSPGPAPTDGRSHRGAPGHAEEGRFYVWTPAQVQALVGPAAAPALCAFLGITREGNFEHKPESVLSRHGDLTDALANGLRILFAAREHRPRPFRDDKILAAWNGLALSALSRGAQVLGDTSLAARATHLGAFVRERLMPQGELRRSYLEGPGRVLAFAEDFAALAVGFLDLYETTFEPSDLALSRHLTDVLLDTCYLADKGAMAVSSIHAEKLVHRPLSLYDNAVPSATSAGLEAVQRLAWLTGEGRYRAVAEAIVRTHLTAMAQNPFGFGNLLAGLDRHLRGPVEVVIVGAPTAAQTRALISATHRTYLPNRALLCFAPGEPPTGIDPLLWQGREASAVPTAYVCRGAACLAPVTEPAALVSLLTEARAQMA